MARNLGQLRCGRCNERFWPEHGESASRAVMCPACGAAHVNPGALPFDWDDGLRYSVGGPLYVEAVEWMRHWWVDLPPGAKTETWWSYLRVVEPGEVHGFPCCVVVGEQRGRKRGIVGNPMTICMVAAWLPETARSTPPPGASLSPVGLYSLTSTMPDRRQAIEQLVATARSIGAEPAFRLDEVDDPTPIAEPTVEEIAPDDVADARLESHAHRCQQCGAPASVTELVASTRCPWCGASQQLPPGLAEELGLYRRRIHAAQLRSSTALVPWSAQPVPPDRVAMACVGCGAPNAHRPGALDEVCSSCGVPLIPSRAAIARGLERQGDATLDAHGASAAALGRRVATMEQSSDSINSAAALGIGVVIVGSFVLYAILAVISIVRGNLVFLIPVIVMAPLTAVVVVLALRRRRRSQQITQRWQPRLAALAEQLNAMPLRSTGAIAAWGTRWWRGVLPWARLMPGPGWGGLALPISGFPVVVSAHVEVIPPIFPQPLRRPPHAGVLLAGTPPRDVAAWINRGEAARLRELFGERGYDLDIQTGGLVLEARREQVGRMTDDPDRLGELAPLAFALARLAHRLRLEPPG